MSATATKTVIVPAKRYENHDDSLAAAARAKCERAISDAQAQSDEVVS